MHLTGVSKYISLPTSPFSNPFSLPTSPFFFLTAHKPIPLSRCHMPAPQSSDDELLFRCPSADKLHMRSRTDSDVVVKSEAPADAAAAAAAAAVAAVIAKWDSQSGRSRVGR